MECRVWMKWCELEPKTDREERDAVMMGTIEKGQKDRK